MTDHHVPWLALALSVALATPASAFPAGADSTKTLSAVGYGAALVVGDGEVFVAEPLNTTRSGVVYVYRRDAAGRWTESQQLRSARAAAGDRFGRALAWQGDLLLVGGTAANGEGGIAFLYRREATGTWRETATLRATDGAPGDAFGAAVSLHDGTAFVAAPGHRGGAGAVYVFRRAEDATWRQTTKIIGTHLGARDRFGSSIAATSDLVAISAPNHGRGSGAVYVFRPDGAGGWIETGKLVPTDLTSRSAFGVALAAGAERILVGAPATGRQVGAVHVFGSRESEWIHEATVQPPDTTPRQAFGASIDFDGSNAWIGAPGDNGFVGAIHIYTAGSSGWQRNTTISGLDAETGDQFGGSVARRNRVAAVGMVGDDYGEGTAVIFEASANGSEWAPVAKVFGDIATLDPILGDQVDCTDGAVGDFPCSEVDVVSFLPLNAIGAKRGVRLNDVWGWTDSTTGREYALVGRLDATVFIDMSDPVRPVYLGELPKTAESPGSTWRDMKVYRNHAFIVADGAGPHGMQVFDLTQLRDVTNPPVIFEATAHYDRIHSAHNIVINEETGFAFTVGNSAGGETCGGGLHVINVQDPRNPDFVGCFAHEATGRTGTGYTHDAQCVVYRGPDLEHRDKEICFGANETALSIADVSDKANPVALAAASYPNVGYAHQGWLSRDQRYFYMNDELDELNGLVDRTRTLIWDVTDLDDPILVKEHFATTQSTDHNLYVAGDYMYQTNNRAGLRILDVRDPENPIEVAYFDPTAHGENTAGFDGTWSSYPFFESGLIVVTSRREGVFILKRRQVIPIP